MNRFSFARFLAVLRKEWIQISRDPLTLRMIVIMPVVQLLLYGIAINGNPKNLPTGLLSAEHSRYERSIITALKNTGYYNIQTFDSEAQAERALADGEVLFVINMPVGFDRAVDRGEKPAILMDVDGTDPSTVGNATGALGGVISALDRDLPQGLHSSPASAPFRFVVHARYNPEQLTVLNIVPGLICMVLIISTLLITTLAITRERERGTMENLLAMPLRPAEVLFAKIVPYIGIGYLQVALVMLMAGLVFDLPMRGSMTVLMLALGLYIASNLALGLTFSTIAANQQQAQQMAQFMFLPTMMLSGFMFPFRGMPLWAQHLGDIFPTTHALRIVRGILLKGSGFSEILPEVWPIIAFTLVTAAVGIWFYRETLD